jgi:hypothetical protein
VGKARAGDEPAFSLEESWACGPTKVVNYAFCLAPNLYGSVALPFGVMVVMTASRTTFHSTLQALVVLTEEELQIAHECSQSLSGGVI